ncbi:hypothetical protein CB0940_08028 [Cercospora beticola]|uniref:Putative zinc-finger domain-containing protein n=1 Tax=Cercospora beticola TaxID=122368 RepID=A0A2G5HPQ2_CERBT|nr:hypothetical protein CB0940_08028 [Cercospora beticola]PIA94202.1 hypothetical protein CB0940_08028 [Cercospora beticola]WPB04584.1 hypothetical protein RHO25_009230 [Cercospora beticola]CAK1364328.1 unnamed protein product [Cercospora beticola]
MSNGSFSWGGAHAASQTSYNQQQQQNRSMTSPNGTANGAPAPGHAPPPSTAAGMPALPPEVLAALQGIAPEQLGAIFHALQSGLIPMPPAPVTPIPATVSAPIDPRAQPSNTRASGAPSNRNIEMGEEDGEIEDGELDGADTPQARGFLRTPPKGPRDPESGRGSHQYQHQTQQQQQQLRPVAVQQPSLVPIPRAQALNGKAPATSSTSTNVSPRPSKEAASKIFVLEMHKAGYKYDDIRREVNEEQLLRRIYNQLDLPIPSGSNTPTGTTKPAAPKAPPAKVVKPAAPKDRSEYLAKLQAAKAKKTEANKLSVTPTASTQPTVPQATEAQRVATNQPSASISTSAAATPPAPKSGVMTKDKTEEVRRRLEAIKAKRAAEQTAKLANDAAANKLASGNGMPFSSGAPPAGGLGAGLVEAAASLATEQPMPPAANAARAPDSNGHQAPASGLVSPPSKQSFGLPGLFTSFAPQSVSQPSSATGAAAGYQAVPTIKDVTSPPAIGIVNGNNAAGSNQTFGDRGGASIDDRCIIALSSDDEDDMDIDDSSDDEQQTQPNPSAPSAQDAPRLPSHSQAATSSPSTPSAYKRKLEEIEAFKQQIAEKEKRRKLQSLSGTPTTSTPNGASPTLAIGEQNDQASSKAATAVSPADPAAIRLARAQEKEVLQRRLRELEALRAGHNSGSPMTAHAITPSMPTSEANTEAQSKANVTTTKPVSLATNETADEIDDDDDEDLYGDSTEASQHQPAQDTRLPPRVDSQATTLSSSSLHSRVDGVVPEDAADYPHAMASTTDDAAARGEYDNSTTSFNPQAALADGGAVDDADEDEDDLDNIYEPPAHMNENVVQMQPPAQDSSAPDDVDSDEAMDTSEESSDDSDDDDDEVYAGKSGHSGAEPSAQVSSSEQEMSAASSESGLGSNDPLDDLDLAPELQAVSDDSSLATTRNDQVQASRYTPYESPLRRFKDYRYHPEYTNTVSGGFKSLTFNHKIDPDALVCPFEIERGQCDVPNCGYQHFHEMALHDNDLLRLMGTERTPARNPEEDKRWKEGLSNLIRELRTTNIGRDAGLIAQRIAEYRRSFVNDPTRVVLLDD